MARSASKLEKEIAALYREHCSGIEIDVMELENVFNVAKAAHAVGLPMKEALCEYVESIRMDKK